MKMSKPSSQAGLTIIELMIVLTIGVVLTTFAVIQFSGSRENLHRQNVAREFKNMLERARFDAVKRRPATEADMSTVKVLSATSFSYTIDKNQNGVLDNPAETTTIDFSQRGDVQVTGDSFIFPITIAFDRRGHITATNGAAQPMNPLFYFCNGSCTPATATPANSNIVYVSPTGTVAMLAGGSTIPTFSPPAVTAVDSNTTVNPLLAVWEVSPATPTPTPDGTPIPTPTPTPTPTPSPSVTPSPSPTPLDCTSGERPAATGCVCKSPMWVRRNGKCQ